jgi:hypothetical protein
MSDDVFDEHDQFKRRLGADYERFCAALITAAQLFQRSSAPSIAYRVGTIAITIKRGT